MAEVKLARSWKIPGAKGSKGQGGNKPHGSIASGKGKSPKVRTPASK